MGGIYIDIEAFKRMLIDDLNILFEPFGIQVVGIIKFEPRKSFWQQLRDEIRNRPKVF